jgi:hypothetical protein
MRTLSQRPTRAHGSARHLAAATLAGLLLLPLSSASAQLINAIKRKAAQALEQRMDDKMSARMDSMSARMAAQAVGNAEGFSLNANVATEPAYAFSVVATYEFSGTERGAAQPAMRMAMHFNETQPFFASRVFNISDGKRSSGDDIQDVTMIFDGKNAAMVTLLNGADGKLSMAYSWKDAAQYASDTSETETPSTTATMERIGTRTILGYNATGYRMVDGDVTTDVWMTTDLDLRFDRMMRASSSVKQTRSAVPAVAPDGMLLESVTRSARDNTEFTMRAVAIDTKANVTFTMAEYPRLGAPTR